MAEAISTDDGGATSATRPIVDTRESTDKSNVFPFFELPAELQINIVNMAFIDVSKVLKTVSVGGWAEDFLDPDRIGYGCNVFGEWPIPRPRFKLQVENFLVSKAFFELAAKPYVECQVIDLSASRAHSGRTLAEQPHSILCKWATKIHISGHWLPYWNVLSTDIFPALKWLEIELYSYRFGPGEAQDWSLQTQRAIPDALQDVLEDEDIYESNAFCDLEFLCGLSGLKLLTAPSELETLAATKLQTFQANLHRLEELLHGRVTKPRAQGHTYPKDLTEEYEDMNDTRILAFERVLNDARTSWT